MKSIKNSCHKAEMAEKSLFFGFIKMAHKLRRESCLRRYEIKPNADHEQFQASIS